MYMFILIGRILYIDEMLHKHVQNKKKESVLLDERAMK